MAHVFMLNNLYPSLTLYEENFFFLSIIKWFLKFIQTISSKKNLKKLLIYFILSLPSHKAISAIQDQDQIKQNMNAPSYVSPLGRSISQEKHRHPNKTGIKLLISGSDALNARIAMIESAKDSLELQYYIADTDQSGKLIIQAILKAAKRGVKVRIILDGMNFKDYDPTLIMLNATKNIEVKIFNPLQKKNGNFFTKLPNLVKNINRLTHRMHNKTMIVDNSAAIIGGRNLSDAYFDISQALNFRDIDVLILGTIVPEISRNFNDFWKFNFSISLNKLSNKNKISEKNDEIRKKILELNEQGSGVANNTDISRVPLDKQLMQNKIKLIWVKAKCWADSPEKITKISGKYISPPAKRLRELIKAATKKLIIVSPYFVPHQDGAEILKQLANNGVNVNILTNSMAATDAPAVQSGYNKYRKELLKYGINLFEFKPLSGKKRRANILGSESKASLHAKTYVIDSRHLLLGSFNFDPRSHMLNTELIIEIDSIELSDKIKKLFEESTSLEDSYQVLLASKKDLQELREANLPISKLIWLSNENGMLVRHHYDPGASFLRNLINAFFTLLPLENQL